MDGQLIFDSVLTIINLILLIGVPVFAGILLYRAIRKRSSEKEILSTFSAEDYAKVKEILEKERISNRVKTTYTGGSNRNRTLMGRIGENPKLTTQYQIFVPKEKYEEAVYRMNQARMNRE